MDGHRTVNYVGAIMTKRKLKKEIGSAFNKTRVARYAKKQHNNENELCKTPHQYGYLHLIGSKSIAGKICKWCGFILYKYEILQRQEYLRMNKPDTHIDLFQF